MTAEREDHGADERLDALSVLLRDGVPGPASACRKQREAELRAAILRRAVPRAGGLLWPSLMVAVGLLAAFALGRVSWRGDGGDGVRPSRPLESTSEPAAPTTTAVQSPVPEAEPALPRAPDPVRRPVEPTQPSDVGKASGPSRPARRSPAPESTPPNVGIGFALLREGRLERAASAFAQVAERGPPRIRGDAAYFHGVCLARSGRTPEAVEVFRRFLSLYPRHEQSDAARVALGWLLMRGPQPADARTAFEQAVDATDPSVSRSARKGLEALTARRSDAGAPNDLEAVNSTQ
jgi:TolA-binding protein